MLRVRQAVLRLARELLHMLELFGGLLRVPEPFRGSELRLPELLLRLLDRVADLSLPSGG